MGEVCKFLNLLNYFKISLSREHTHMLGILFKFILSSPNKPEIEQRNFEIRINKK